ncbi:MAG: glutaredoxin 3 [Bdellovibrionales bacterium CG10_big_fil_rev_8_21_14_0_10_45_34]|nr:MAG: glutaredoxin 3 [Bdellovibrionales bacterium CG10_big_fil_rev_8_21_14_0_10_45_34]
MKNVTIYTKDFCPFCDRAKVLLNQKGVDFEEINVETKGPNFYNELKAKTGLRTVPQIFIGDSLVGGYTELRALEDADKLDEMLK